MDGMAMQYTGVRPQDSPARIVPKLLRIGFWASILAIAFFMQVVPFLLILTMLNLAIGITSGVALILIPVAAFGMLFFACWIATRQTRNMSGEAQALEHAKRQIYVAPYPQRDGPMQLRNMHTGLLPHLQRFRSRLY